MPLGTRRKDNSETLQLSGPPGNRPFLNLDLSLSEREKVAIINEVFAFNKQALAQQSGVGLSHQGYYLKSISRSFQSKARIKNNLSNDDKLVLGVYGRFGLYFNRGLRVKPGTGNNSESHAKALLDYTLENKLQGEMLPGEDLLSAFDRLVQIKFIPKTGTMSADRKAILRDENKKALARSGEIGVALQEYDYYAINTTSLLLDQIIERNAEYFNSGETLFRVSRAKRGVFASDSETRSPGNALNPKVRVTLGSILYERGFISTSSEADSVLKRYSDKSFGGEGVTQGSSIPTDEEEVLFVILNNGSAAGIDISGFKFNQENFPVSSGEFLLNRNSRFRLLARTIPEPGTRRIVVVSTLAHESISRDAPVYDIFNGSRFESGDIDDAISNFRERRTRDSLSDKEIAEAFENRIKPPTDIREIVRQFGEDENAHSSASGTDQNSDFEKLLVADQIQNQADSFLATNPGNLGTATGGLSSETSTISSESPTVNPIALQTSETSTLSEASVQAEALEGEIEAISELAVL
ncbi:MAG: hypothetical protein QM538_06380 [Methylacidiphilales bacterium]|nr:hypothetical protein [Candidatus Methylacidiphilales bacterium]